MVRIKERYLLVNIIYPPNSAKPANAGIPSHVVQHQPTTDSLTPQSLLKAIRTEVASLFGEHGAGALEGNLIIKYLSPATSTFIVRCSRSHYQMVWAALTFLDYVPTKQGPGRPCIFRVVRVSGTIRKAEEEAIRQAKKLILAAKAEASSATSTSTAALPAPVTKDEIMLSVSDHSSDEAMDDAGG